MRNWIDASLLGLTKLVSATHQSQVLSFFEKGKELAQKLGLTDFQKNRGWIDRFELRLGIGMKIISGEAASAPAHNNRVERKGAAGDFQKLESY